MSMKAALVSAAAIVAASLSLPVAAQPLNGEQAEARREMRAGNEMRVSELQNRAFRSLSLPICRRGQTSKDGRCIEYLGFDYDSSVPGYRFKFVRKDRVFYVDVHAQTGRVLRRVD